MRTIVGVLALVFCLPALAEDARGSWWDRTQQQIRRAEYEITWQDAAPHAPGTAGWQAPNRAQGFRTRFTDRGIRLVPRAATAPSWELTLDLLRCGRPGAMEPAGPARLSPASNRIDFRRNGIDEWYVNDSRGLEQGFVLVAIPGDEADGPLRLELALGGDLSPVVSADGGAIDFVAPGGARVLRYAELHVYDAAGFELGARMEAFSAGGERGIRIVIDDREAVYPISVDPLLTGPAWVVEGDQALGDFGFAVATAGDVNGDGYSDVIVGALRYDNGEGDEGMAFVYHGSPSGPALAASWTAEGDQESAMLGHAVATAGDVDGDGYSDVIVGASEFENGEPNEGAAFVYHGSPAGLASAPAWIAEGNQADGLLGSAVAPAGDVNGDGYADVIVGMRDFTNVEQVGVALVYHGSAGGLSATADWTAEGGAAFDQMGRSVSTAGDVNGDGYSDVVVGANGFDNGSLDEGAAFVYHGSAGGLSVTEDWMVEGNQTAALLGVSVSTAGDVNGDGYADVIVGAPSFDNGEEDEGIVYVYHGSATGLEVFAAWSAEGGQANAKFARSGTAGDVNGDGYADVIVGARQFSNGETKEGAIFVYHGSALGLSPVADWMVEGDQANALMGRFPATAGDVNGDGYSDVIVGAHRYTNEELQEGRVFVYFGSPSGISSDSEWAVVGSQALSFLGRSVSSAGDVNGDGYSDLLVGALGFDTPEQDAGRAVVYHGSPDGPSLPGWSGTESQEGARYGFATASAGDVNGDGYSDVIVGAYRFDGGLANEGGAWLYLGSASGLASAADWTAQGAQAHASFGYSVAGAGDVNGDGYQDVIVGAPDFDNGQNGEGRALLYAGSPVGLSASPIWAGEIDVASAAYGHAVATAGDVNADGFSDVIVGAVAFENGEIEEGAAFVYHGSAAGLASAPDWMDEGDQSSANIIAEAAAEFGHAVGTAGDVNGDGYADVIVGAPGYDNGEADEGRAYIYYGSAPGLSPVPDWTAEVDLIGAAFGFSAATAGDVSGDGFADVVVGAPYKGRAYVFLGSAAGPLPATDWSGSGQLGAFFGISVASAGDVNGDGYGDVVVGEHAYSSGSATVGRAHLFYGNASAGIGGGAQQRRVDDASPIVFRGDSPNSFRLAGVARTPFGRGRVKLEREVKPLGVPLDGSGTEVGVAWIDTGTGGVTYDEPVNGLDPDSAYHWRVRLLYDPGVLFLPATRWSSNTRGGTQETMLRMGAAVATSAGSVPDGDGVAGVPLLLDKVGGDLLLTWSGSCNAGDEDYAIYSGSLGDYTTHAPVDCSTGGLTSATVEPANGDAYFLVVPRVGSVEGSYGVDGDGLERSQGALACLTQSPGACR